ncbi:FitA-like ribbon-helix-helix domain-containing protein [Rivibacter subsaxonicus]|uniref:Arc-like DNA binding dprotein n=1 Tax=Rivibacter subsaxonicus TaxID=457575 RepID=A0A4Q7VZE0_9BURK|nr:Arc family DNA-binding protein [Rivibacter subsaxonicus]RZU02187.1 Arc-like DNA binding dprotein [Rivibacter subsaxonicus]
MSVNLSIKNVPDEVAEQLRLRAERNHRSLQGELMAIVQQAASEREATRAGPGTQSFMRGTRSIEQTAAELRKRFPAPAGVGPLAVDIIRADRDSR